MSITTKTLILALALSPAAAQHLRGSSVGRRSLRESTPVDTFRAKGEADELTGRVQFKLNPKHPGILAGRASALAEQVSANLDCKAKAKRLFRPAGKHEASHVEFGLHLWYTLDCGRDDPKLNVHATSVRAADKISQFIAMPDRMHDGVEIVEPEIVHKKMFVADDTYIGQQTHYDSINLQDAWDITTGAKHVVVQVLDSGIDTTHEDFQYNIWTNPGEIPGNGIDDDENGYVDDVHGWNHADGNNEYLGDGNHGSHCGGTIAADTNNGKGVAGIAGGDGTVDENGRGRKGVQLMVSVGFGTNTGGFDEALIYGADNGAQISSNSWGYGVPNYMMNSEKVAIDYYNSKNGIVVFAAGNDDDDSNWLPGALPGVVGVAALKDDGQRAWFSNFGSWVDIAAPGNPVLSTGIGNYVYMSGTSMACPHVAGVLALGLSVNPALAKDELLECLFSTAIDIDDKNPGYVGKLGAGMADASAFVRCCAYGMPSMQPTISFEPTGQPTPQPTPEPTFSLAPTEKCDCDQELVLQLKTDRYASETSWALDMHDPAKGCVDASAQGGGFNRNRYNYRVVLATNICAEQTYTFRLVDEYGDGICCGWTGKGSYKLLLNDVVIKSGGNFGFEDAHTFTAPVVTAEPTFYPTAKPTAFPTHVPTTAAPSTTFAPIGVETPAPTNEPTSRCDALAPLRDQWKFKGNKGCAWAEAKPWRCSKTGVVRMKAADACTECPGNTRAESLDWRKWKNAPASKGCAWAAQRGKCGSNGFLRIAARDACCGCPP